MRRLADRWEYDPTDELGRGGDQARIVGGRDLRTGQPVAVKLLSPTASPAARQRFLEEADFHSRLRHPAIVPLVGHGRDGDQHYIVTPQLAHGSLRTRHLAQGRRPFTPALTLRIGEQIADALDYLHADAVHGDVSPGNILLDADDNAHLTDFGISKRRVAGMHTTTRDWSGTPGFMSPRDHGKRTYADDVYGLAAVLWWCLTGKRYGESWDELPPAALQAPLRSVLAWDEDATPTAAELADDLHAHWRPSALRWRHPSLVQRRSRAPLVAAAGLAGLALAALAGQLLPAGDADAAQTTLRSTDLTLSVPAGWAQRTEPALDGLRLRSPLAAEDAAGARVTAGLARPAGSLLLPPPARQALPLGARSPRQVVVDGLPALRYGPAAANASLTRGVEVLAFALEHDVLVLECRGPAARVQRICAQAAAGLSPSGARVQPLMPTRTAAASLRAAVRALNDDLDAQGDRLAAAARPAQARAAAGAIGRAYRRYAEAVGAVPANARTTVGLNAVERAAQGSAAAFARLAATTTDAGWSAARSRALARERELGGDVRRLRALGYSTGR